MKRAPWIPLLAAACVCARAPDPPVVTDGAPLPIEPVPAPRQLAWAELEFYAFVHFNMNTFTGREWGDGTESPALFAPSELDCRQWARVAKDAGMRGIILTAKHHDGFCLWPSKLTGHTVANSPWRDGKGDVVRELSDACREAGLRFGVYLSPWDRNSPLYGDSPKYNDFYAAQLEELLQGYGEVFEVWWDGACAEGPSGKRQVYDFERFTAIVRKLQPDAVIFSDIGPDVRWVGNEDGIAGETNWSMLETAGFARGIGAPPARSLSEGDLHGRHWIPAECDVSIRPGWYYHPEQDGQVKSVDHLVDLYERSVGRNAALLLNLPVDRRGLVHENDAARLGEMRRALDATYATDLARGARASASSTRGEDPLFAPERVLDGDASTCWAPEDGTVGPSLTLELAEPALVDRVVLGEAVALGQRVARFHVEARVGGQWREFAAATTIGRKRILRTEPLSIDGLRITIDEARATPTLASVALACTPPRIEARAERLGFLDSTVVELRASQPGASIHYTLDGSDPTTASPRVEGPLRIDRTASLVARAFRGRVASIGSVRMSFRRYQPGELLHALHFLRAPSPGARFACHAPGTASLAELGAATPLATGECAGIDLDLAECGPDHPLVLGGTFDAPADGVYELDLRADFDWRLTVDGTLVAEGRNGRGSVGLQRGWHNLELACAPRDKGARLEGTFAGPSGTIELRALPLHR